MAFPTPQNPGTIALTCDTRGVGRPASPECRAEHGEPYPATDSGDTRFPRGRVHFKLHRLPAGGHGGNRPVFSSALVIIGNGPKFRLSTYSTPGIDARERQLGTIANSRLTGTEVAG